MATYAPIHNDLARAWWLVAINSKGTALGQSQCQCNKKKQEGTRGMAGLGTDPVRVFWTGRALYQEFLRLWNGFELPSSWTNLPDYGPNRKRSGLGFMRWSYFDHGAQDLKGSQRPNFLLLIKLK
jgi:hypothetical protein